MSCLMRGLVLLTLLAAPLVTAAGPDAQSYLILEDGSQVMFSDLKAKNPGACCIPLNFPFAVTWVSTDKVRLFNAVDNCKPGFELKSSSFPFIVKSINVCASDSSAMGGKVPIGLKAACANNNGLLYQDKTCKAIANKDGSFAYRLLCRKDCDNIYKCLEPTFDYSKCPGVPPQLAFASLGEKCNYIKENKQYVCGGNKNSCKDGVCVSGYPSAGGRRLLR